MDNLYMHLGMAWSVMNYSSISYLAGELYRISTMLYQVRPCVYVFWCCRWSLAAVWLQGGVSLLLTFFCSGWCQQSLSRTLSRTQVQRAELDLLSQN
jgi:hypothetical protein